MKKAVLLHPLNERGKQDCERGLASSLKVWGQHKTRRHREAAPGIGTFKKEHQREHQGGTRDSEEKI